MKKNWKGCGTFRFVGRTAEGYMIFEAKRTIFYISDQRFW